jgi:hypothetical protein
MSIPGALLAMLAAAAHPPPAHAPPAHPPPAHAPPAHAPPPHKAHCKKHLIVTFAVYSELHAASVQGNGCWAHEDTVQELGHYTICHFAKPPPPKRAISIYDDVNPSHRGEQEYLQGCAAAGDELWEYLTPPYDPIVKGFHKLKRLYAELYDSGTRSPMPYLSRWKRKQTVAGHRIWPMIDVSEHAGSAAAIERAVHQICRELPNHGILGIYSVDSVTRAPPKDKKQYQAECVDKKHPLSQHCNGRAAAIAAALDACTTGR